MKAQVGGGRWFTAFETIFLVGVVVSSESATVLLLPPPVAGNSCIPLMKAVGLFVVEIEGQTSDVRTEGDVGVQVVALLVAVNCVSIVWMFWTAVSIPSSLTCAEAMVSVGKFPESCDNA